MPCRSADLPLPINLRSIAKPDTKWTRNFAEFGRVARSVFIKYMSLVKTCWVSLIGKATGLYPVS